MYPRAQESAEYRCIWIYFCGHIFQANTISAIWKSQKLSQLLVQKTDLPEIRNSIQMLFYTLIEISRDNHHQMLQILSGIKTHTIRTGSVECILSANACTTLCACIVSLTWIFLQIFPENKTTLHFHGIDLMSILRSYSSWLELQKRAKLSNSFLKPHQLLPGPLNKFSHTCH